MGGRLYSPANSVQAFVPPVGDATSPARRDKIAMAMPRKAAQGARLAMGVDAVLGANRRRGSCGGF
ncbi:hypothetical protein Sp245p_22305 (plasmid) [Azospirillum baldaniorum]|uniref:Uncharacterized protein n=1 Tax=Azospirillum baldaniorum TaxID=1064539 RepID=A0A9P1JWE0_9PROT|nr:hypothetical protein Sp245p_22305 [Azospirillum baldaniorum]CCD01042.1 protein of unknown function [Azospirillum baldaniorum]